MKASLLAARRSNLLRQAVGVGIFEQLEQRRMLSATQLTTLPYVTQDSNPSPMYVVGGTTLFFADDATGSQHLYQTDGTAAGTQLVSTQSLDNSTSGGADVAVSGNNLFYITDTGNGQQIEEASVGSGGAITMTQLTNIAPDNNLNRYDIEGIAVVGPNVYFWTNDNSNAPGDTTPFTLWMSNSPTSTNLGSFSEIDEVSGINGKAIIAANDGTDGMELWVSDGTTVGTVPLQQSGGGDVGAPVDFVADGTNLFFVANDGSLYYTDGTEAGTKQAPDGPNEVDVNGTSTELNTSEHLSVLSGDVYYNSDGYLYKTTADGQTTTQVSGAVHGVYYLEPMGGDIYFQGDDSTHGRELWKSDGTSGGTDLVDDINPGTGNSWPKNLTASGNELFFQDQPNAGDEQFFATDGTTVTQLTQTIENGDDFENFISAGATSGVAYTSFNDGFHGTEPFKLTSTGASLLSDVNTASEDESQSPGDTAQVGNTVYFVSGNSGGDDNTLWKTDGTAAGTVNITPTVTIGSGVNATTASLASGMEIENLVGGSSVLYFESNADGTNNALWMYNGTTAAPVQYIPTSSITPTDIVNPGGREVIGNTLYFDFDDGTHGDELWMTDGTVAGTKMVKDINPGSGSSDTDNFEVLGSKLLFTAEDGSSEGRELWVSDGTSAGTVAIKHLLPGDPSFDFGDYAVVGNNAYFTVDSDNTTYLWKTDGTAAGTVNVGVFGDVDLPSYGVAGDDEGTAPVIGNDFFFAASSLTGGDEGESLWKTDGTQAGTVLVKSGRSGEEDDGFDPDNIVNLNSTTIVMEAYGPDGEELFKSDGTTAGTVEVKDINPGEVGSGPDDLVVLNGEVYFSATSGDTGAGPFDRELWKSDGTAAGTTEVKQIFTGTTGYYGDGPLFSADAPDEGSEGADVYNVTVSGSKIFFNADDGIHGTELWETDGTAAGTFMVQDINPTEGSFPDNLSPIVTPSGDNALVFFADNGTQGDQPYSVIATSYGLVVSSSTLSVPENGNNTFTVDLSAAPTANVTVTIVEESGGSATLNATPTTLIFTPSNWDTAQTVTVAGGVDDAALNSTAIFDISAPNVATQNVAATEIAGTTGTVVLSSTAVNVPEGGSATFSVHLSAAPLGTTTVTITRTDGDSILTSSPATLVFNASNYATNQIVTLSSGTDTDFNDDTATFTVSASGMPDQTVTATQLDDSGPVIGGLSVTPSTGTSKSKIKLTASSITGDSGVGTAADVTFYMDTNGNGVFDYGDAALKTVKVKKGSASFSLKAKTLSAGVTTFFAVANDSDGNTGQPVSGTFTLNASSNVKKSALRNAPLILADSTQESNINLGITQDMFSQMPILG